VAHEWTGVILYSDFANNGGARFAGPLQGVGSRYQRRGFYDAAVPPSRRHTVRCRKEEFLRENLGAIGRRIY